MLEFGTEDVQTKNLYHGRLSCPSMISELVLLDLIEACMSCIPLSHLFSRGCSHPLIVASSITVIFFCISVNVISFFIPLIDDSLDVSD